MERDIPLIYTNAVLRVFETDAHEHERQRHSQNDGIVIES